VPQIIIHRGAHTIGGSCIEINSNGCRILLDAGMPLMEKGGGEIDKRKMKNPSVENGILPDVKGLYKNQAPEVDAVFISHAHIDHYGLLNHIHPKIPVYLSEGSHALIKIGKVFYPDGSKIFFDNFRTFEHYKPVELGPFKITSYLMDHSGYDASSFLIEAESKKVFYSGDFRGHGRKAKLLENMVKRPIKNVDCLLMEGTTLGGGHKVGFKNEEEIEKGLYDIFSRQKDVSFFMASGSNIDRIVSLYKAARNSNKILVLDLYTYYVLDQLKRLLHGRRLPPHKNDNIRIYYIGSHAQNIVDYLGKEILYKFKKRKIEIEEIVARRQEIVVKLPVFAMERISKALEKNRPLKDVKFIFSMWSGYLEKNAAHYKFCNKYQVELVKVHVSGHAYLDALKSLAQALNPKTLVPVHTLERDNFSEHFDNVKVYDDGVPFEIK